MDPAHMLIEYSDYTKIYQNCIYLKLYIHESVLLYYDSSQQILPKCRFNRYVSTELLFQIVVFNFALMSPGKKELINIFTY